MHPKYIVFSTEVCDLVHTFSLYAQVCPSGTVKRSREQSGVAAHLICNLTMKMDGNEKGGKMGAYLGAFKGTMAAS